MSKGIQVVNGIPRLREIYASVPPAYDENIVVSAGGISTGTPITLPNSQTYDYLDLQIILNGQSLTPQVDWNTYGSGLKTQVTMTFDLVEGDQLRFRINVPTT